MRGFLWRFAAGCTSIEGPPAGRIEEVCSDPPPFATGTSTLAVSACGDQVWVANAEEGSVSVVPLEGGSPVEIAVGLDPARLTRAGDRVFVTLAGEGAVVSLRQDAGVLAEESRYAVGGEPFGVLAAPDGSRVYVAISLEDRVEERDAETFELLRAWTVPDQPRWLAITPSGASLYAASALRGTLTRILLEHGEVHPMALPTVTREGPDGLVTLTARITGDPGVSPSGDELAVPVFLLDTETLEPPPSSTPTDYYVAPVTDGEIGRFNPGLDVFDLDVEGAPIFDESMYLGTSRGDVQYRSMPVAAVAYLDRWMVPLEGSDATLVVDRVRREGAISGGFGMVSPSRSVTLVSGGPRGIAVLQPDPAVSAPTLMVHGWLDRVVAPWDYPRSFPVPTTLGVTPALSSSAERGRLLFNTAMDARIVAPGAGISCGTCHFGGRSDGIVWPLNVGARNTPSLAGPIADTAPFTWTDSVGSVADEAFLTSTQRMGGVGIGPIELADIAVYVDTLRSVAPAADSDDLGLGAAAFGSAGCATCHGGPSLTNNQGADVLGVMVDTPSLAGVSASPPYFHDGRAATLEDVLALAAAGLMGDTRELTEHEVDALLAYLRSL